MKKTLLKLSAALLLSFQLTAALAQAPQKMSYQAVIRNSGNALVTSSPIGMQISILQGSATGTPVYVETQTATTNTNGLISIEIGNGTPVTGTFSSINWAAGPYFIMTETDPTGGTTYSITGTTQLMSVPYALYAETSGTGVAGPAGPQGPTGADGINGTNGADGATGPMGPMGPMGMPGMSGTNGTNGAVGATGADGTQGPQGPAGTNGINGAAGATGADGPQGVAGTNGTNGAVGATGVDGPQGPQGIQGIQGIAGTNGTNGAVGATGPMGPMGMPGMPGTNGTNGTNGAVGATGADGIQGLQGIQGPAGANGLDGATGATGLLANGAAAGNTPYWNGTAWVTNNSNIFNNGGNVGVGTATPAFKLDVLSPAVFIANFATSSTTDRTSLLKVTNNNATPAGWLWAVGGTGNGLGLVNGEMYIESHLGARDFIVRNQASPLTETFRVRGSNGYVGIGNATPNAALQFGNVLSNRRIVLWEDANNDHQFYGFGMNGNILRYQVAAPGQSHAFYAGTSATTSNELMRIQGNGNVGIGTSAPSAKLEVTGSTKINGQLEIATTTGALLIPRLTTTERTALTAVPGMMIYNSNTGKFQGYAAALGVEALDQSMTAPNTQLNSTYIGQSFIAGATGELSKIDVTVSTFSAAGSFTISVYAGTGTGGALLGSLGGTISSAGIKSFALTGINVTAGNTYTFMIVHSANCTWSMDNTNSYPSGSVNTGMPNPSWDLWFKTYVKPIVNSWVDFH
jgi:hypothetical protein